MSEKIHETHFKENEDNDADSNLSKLKGTYQVEYAGTYVSGTVKMQVQGGDLEPGEVGTADWIDVPNSSFATRTTFIVELAEMWVRFIITGATTDIITVKTHKMDASLDELKSLVTGVVKELIRNQP